MGYGESVKPFTTDPPPPETRTAATAGTRRDGTFKKIARRMYAFRAARARAWGGAA